MNFKKHLIAIKAISAISAITEKSPTHVSKNTLSWSLPEGDIVLRNDDTIDIDDTFAEAQIWAVKGICSALDYDFNLIDCDFDDMFEDEDDDEDDLPTPPHVGKQEPLEEDDEDDESPRQVKHTCRGKCKTH